VEYSSTASKRTEGQGAKLAEVPVASIFTRGESVDGLFWDTVGAGPPLIVVHGAMGFDHTYFRPWLDRLGERAQVVYFDLSGCGESQPTDEISIERWADDVEAVREAAGCERVTVLGHSMSTWIALEYARRWPERTSSLILCCGTPTFDFVEEIFAAATRRFTEAQLHDLQTIHTVSTLDEATYRRLLLSILPLYFRHYRHEYGAGFSAMRFDARVYLHTRNTYLAGYDCTPWLKSIDVKTLVLAGRDDVITPPDRAGSRFVDLMPNATLHVFEESGHFPFIEEPEAFTEVVGEWLGGR